MKILVKFNKNIATPKQVKSFKVFNLGTVITTINDLLDSATIEIDDQTLPVLKVINNSFTEYYLIDNVGLTPGLSYPYYTDDFMKDITISDLILFGNSGSGSGIQTITGDFVDNADPLNPIVNVNEVNLGQVINDRLAIKLTPSANDEIVMLDSITGEAVTAKYNSLGFIPITGTTVGNPVTGNIEFEADNGFGLFSLFEGTRRNRVSFDDMVSLSSLNEVNGDIYEIRLSPTEFLINANNGDGKGITGGHDYSTNIADLDYTQKIYVDTYTQVTTATRGTVNIDSGRRDLVLIHEAGATTALTLNLPTSPKNNQKVTIMSVGGIVGLTLATVVGTIVGAVTTLAALGTTTFIWNSSQSKWYKIS